MIVPFDGNKAKSPLWRDFKGAVAPLLSISNYELEISKVAKKWLDGIKVKNISKNAKNTCHCSEIPLHKNFKLTLEQNVTNQTYLKLSCRSQKCSVQLLNHQFNLVNWILFTNDSTRLNFFCKMNFAAGLFKKWKTDVLFCRFLSRSCQNLRINNVTKIQRRSTQVVF